MRPALPSVTITFRNNMYAGPAFETRLRRSRQPEKVVIRAPGYQSESLVVIPSEDSTVPVTLTRQGPVTALPMDKPLPPRYPMWRPMIPPMTTMTIMAPPMGPMVDPMLKELPD